MPLPSSVISIRIWSPTCWAPAQRSRFVAFCPPPRALPGFPHRDRQHCAPGEPADRSDPRSWSCRVRFLANDDQFDFLPSWRARSRARRGYFWNRRPIGCMRVFITAFCRSPTSRSSWLTASSSERRVLVSRLPCRISVRSVVRRFLVSRFHPTDSAPDPDAGCRCGWCFPAAPGPWQSACWPDVVPEQPARPVCHRERCCRRSCCWHRGGGGSRHGFVPAPPRRDTGFASQAHPPQEQAPQQQAALQQQAAGQPVEAAEATGVGSGSSCTTVIG